MIEWMQRHRKYLVVTIWISTIAFVGAGFVGWGAYSFSKDRASSVAKVGKRNISIREFQLTYSNVYNYYRNLFNGSLTQEQADKMGFKEKVMQQLIQKELLLNYADDLGLKALDNDIKSELVRDDSFKKDGVFDIELYRQILKSRGLTPKEYEASLKKEILLNKVQKLLSITPNQDTINLFASSTLMEDKVKLKTISVQPKEIEVNDKLLEEFWKPIKDKFLTKKTYEIATYYLDSDKAEANSTELQTHYEEKKHNFLDSDGKIKNFEDAQEDVKKSLALSKTKKEALKAYLSIKKGKMDLKDRMNIDDEDSRFVSLKDASINDTLKPIRYENGYLVVKLLKIDEPKTMSFEEAKPQVKSEYIDSKMAQMLEERAKAGLKNFQGTDIGFVSIDSNKTIPSLTQSESKAFLNQLFTNNNKKSYVILGNKAVLYDILEQKLLSNVKLQQYNEQLTKMAKDFENDQIQKSLLDELRKRYSIEQYYKGS